MSIPTKDIAITEAPGNKTLNKELERPRKLLLQSPSQPINLFPASLPILNGWIRFWKKHKTLLALTSLWEIRLLSNLCFLWMLSSYWPDSLAAHNTMATDSRQWKLKLVGVIAAIGKASLRVDVSASPLVMPFSYVAKGCVCPFLPNVLVLMTFSEMVHRYLIAWSSVFSHEVSIKVMAGTTSSTSGHKRLQHVER